MEGFNFSTEILVRFAETDAQGIAHHASFVVWFEVARVAYLSEHAGGYLAIQAQGIEALTTAVDVRYHRAALLRRPPPDLDALRRRPRRALPLRVRGRAGRRARGGGLDGARDRRRGHPPADARPGVVRRDGG